MERKRGGGAEVANPTLTNYPYTHIPPQVIVSNFNWLLDPSIPLPPGPLKCRVRHLQPLVDCWIRRLDSLPNRGLVRVQFATPIRAVAEGQFCVVYGAAEQAEAGRGAAGGQGRVVVGGGEILKRGQNYFERGKELVRE